MSTTPGVRGRPRLEKRRRTGDSAAEEILDAAAELFTSRGYAGTSTRMIAEAVGIRQPSLYHHFATKDDIMAALLQRTVAAALARGRELLAGDGAGPDGAGAGPGARASGPGRTEDLDRLCELVRFDAGLLASARWNLGALYLLPELSAERFEEFRAARDELARIYETLAVRALGAASDPLRHLPLRLVESVINMRSDGAISGPGGMEPAQAVDTIVAAVRRVIGER